MSEELAERVGKLLAEELENPAIKTKIIRVLADYAKENNLAENPKRSPKGWSGRLRSGFGSCLNS